MADASRDGNFVTTLLAVSSVDGKTPVVLWADPVSHRLLVDGSGAGGTVTSVSVVSANGISGTVANSTTTPAITLTLGDITPNSVTIGTLTPGSILFAGTGGTVSQDNASLFFDDSNNRLGLLTNVPTHTLTLGSTSSGVALYNTTDQTTNYERGSLSWQSNRFDLAVENAGTGTVRALALVAYNTNKSNKTQVIIKRDTAFPWVQVSSDSTGTTSATIGVVDVLNSGFGASSSTQISLSLRPNVNQTGTASYVGLLINPTETAIGSGTNYLADLQVGGVERFSVLNTGLTTVTVPADTASLQILNLKGTRATPTTNDEVYQSFSLNNSTPASKEFGRITVRGTTITSTSEEGQVIFSVITSGSLSQKISLTNQFLRPVVNDGIALGSSTVSFSDLFVASGAVLNFANGNATITHATGNLTVGTANLLVTSPGTATNSVAVVDATQTLTNKRINPRVGTVASSATPTINSDNVDAFSITALAIAITSFTTNLSGTPVNFQTLIIRILDNGTARTIAWGASFASKGGTLPTTTVAGKLLTVGFKYDSVTSLWGCIAVAQET